MSGNSLLERFQGPHGSNLLRQAMQEQQCVCFSAPIADQLIASGELVAYNEDAVLMEEGAGDKDIYFLLTGLVAVEVTDRQVALRAAGQHAGEMAMIDPMSVRSATVVAVEDTVALRVPEPAFSTIANQYPVLWRRLATDLAGRSRASNKLIPQVNERPVLFLAAAPDQISIADFIRTDLSRDKIIVRLWLRNAFAAAQDTLEELKRLVSTSDFAVIICPDELLRSRNGNAGSVRDNLLLEVGMSAGVLGHARMFLVTVGTNDRDKTAESLQVLSPDFSISNRDFNAQIASLCTEIRNRAQFFGVR
jgi:CRP/FNR family transcriptional regulator, cyclic AMP receptor protein